MVLHWLQPYCLILVLLWLQTYCLILVLLVLLWLQTYCLLLVRVQVHPPSCVTGLEEGVGFRVCGGGPGLERMDDGWMIWLTPRHVVMYVDMMDG